MLGCLDRLSSGRYLLEGIDVSQHDKRALALIRNQKIGFVFQGFNLLRAQLPWENTALPTLYTKIDKAERESVLRRRWAMAASADRAQHFPSQDVRGTAQRVAVARALVTTVDPAGRRATGNLRQPHFLLRLWKSFRAERQRINHRTGYARAWISLSLLSVCLSSATEKSAGTIR